MQDMADIRTILRYARDAGVAMGKGAADDRC